MQYSHDQIADHNVVVHKLTEIFRDHSQPFENSCEKYHVICESDLFLKKNKIIEQQVNILARGDVLIVLLNSSLFSKLKKLISLALLEFRINRMKGTLGVYGVDFQGAFALYPDLHNVRVIYQRNTSAARYAENNLLSPVSGSINRILNRLLLSLFKTSPLIDNVALVWTKS